MFIKRCSDAPVRYSKLGLPAFICALSVLMLCALPVNAYADTEGELASARSQLEEIGTKADELSSQLETLTAELEAVRGEVMIKEGNLSEAQENLAAYMSTEYKGGGLSIVSAVVGAESISDALSRLSYIGKIQDRQTKAIQEVASAKAELEAKEVEQQASIDETQTAIDELNAQRDAASSLVNSLSAELKAELETEAASNAALSSGLTQSTAEQVQSAEEIIADKQTTTNSASASNASSDSSNSSNASSNDSTSNSNNSSGVDNSNNGTTQLPDNSNGNGGYDSNRTRDYSIYDVSWSGDSGYINAVANKAASVGSSTGYFLAWDNELCRFMVFTRSGGGWSLLYAWNCNGARNTYSGAWTVVHKQICNWADRYFGMGYNDWSTCFIEAYSDSSDYLRYIEGKGYEDCASIHSTGQSTTGWDNTGCCGLTWDNAKWIYDNVPTGTTVYVFRYSDGRVF